ncbi:MAG: transcription termination factor NusA [Candidatus Muiribacteriaceae bacterium]
MNAQILQAVDQLQREKGINKEIVVDAIKSAVISALQKKFADIEEMSISFDDEDGEIRVYAKKRVVKGLAKTINDIALQEAREHDPDLKIGDYIDIELAPDSVGRIAAQTARQIIVQKIKEAEKDNIYKQYASRMNDMIKGNIQKVQSDESVLVDLGNIEAIVTRKDQIPGERFRTGNLLKGIISEVKRTSRGPLVYISRTSPEFLKRLFEQEIPEISDGIIRILSVSREPGSRSKIAVISDNDKVDPVGACVGVKGVRIQQIVNELRGEKIDVIRYNDDIRQFITNALAPSEVVSIEVKRDDSDSVETEVVVPDHHLSLAIGKEGQNVRLAARLVGAKIDILSESQKKQRLEEILDRE